MYISFTKHLLELPGLSEDGISALVDGISGYINNMISEDAQDIFMDSIIECMTLIQEGLGPDVRVILSQVDRLALLGLLVQNPPLPWSNPSDLIPFIAEGKELELLGGLAPTINNLLILSEYSGEVPLIEFFTHIIPALQSNFIVPNDLDLSRSFIIFAQLSPNRTTWRKYTKTLMYYLDHGAFNALSDPESIRGFLDLCIRITPRMRRWDRELQIGRSTHNRATEYLDKLNARVTGP